MLVLPFHNVETKVEGEKFNMLKSNQQEHNRNDLYDFCLCVFNL